MSEIAPEDALRINVLMAGEVLAIRIDESKMVVHALSDKGEAEISLHPSGRPEQYLRQVKELLAGLATGSPGGYPVHLRRWTRMGQARNEGLDKLLLFGEPEAVISVACSPGLTDELARRVWWIMPDSQNARRMLERKSVVEGKMGKVLVDFLIEFLPFETESRVFLDTVRLILRSDLADLESKKRLWKMGRRDAACYVGFLEILPDDLPEQDPPRPGLEDLSCGEPFRDQLLRAFSGPGQTFLRKAEDALKLPADRDVSRALLDAISGYFSPVGLKPCESIEEAEAQAKEFSEGKAFPEECYAMAFLASLGSRVLHPLLARTTASGTLLRDKLEPAFRPVLEQIAVLRGTPFSGQARRIRGSRS